MSVTSDTTMYVGGNSTKGIAIGYNTDAKVGFYGVTPVVQASAITAATDTTTLVTSVTAIIAALKGIGITA